MILICFQICILGEAKAREFLRCLQSVCTRDQKSLGESGEHVQQVQYVCSDRNDVQLRTQASNSQKSCRSLVEVLSCVGYGPCGRSHLSHMANRSKEPLAHFIGNYTGGYGVQRAGREQMRVKLFILVRAMRFAI